MATTMVLLLKFNKWQQLIFGVTKNRTFNIINLKYKQNWQQWNLFVGIHIIMPIRCVGCGLKHSNFPPKWNAANFRSLITFPKILVHSLITILPRVFIISYSWTSSFSVASSLLHRIVADWRRTGKNSIFNYFTRLLLHRIMKIPFWLPLLLKYLVGYGGNLKLWYSRILYITFLL